MDSEKMKQSCITQESQKYTNEKSDSAHHGICNKIKSNSTCQDAFVFGNIFIQKFQLLSCIKNLSQVMETCNLKADSGNQNLSDKEIEDKIELCIITLKSFNLHYFEDCKKEMDLRSSPTTVEEEDPTHCGMFKTANVVENYMSADENVYEEYNIDQTECMNSKEEPKKKDNLEFSSSNRSTPEKAEDSNYDDPDITSDAISSHVYESISSAYLQRKGKECFHNNPKQQVISKSLPNDTDSLTKNEHSLVHKKCFSNDSENVFPMLRPTIDDFYHLEKEDGSTRVAKWVLAVQNDRMKNKEYKELLVQGHDPVSCGPCSQCSTRSLHSLRSGDSSPSSPQLHELFAGGPPIYLPESLLELLCCRVSRPVWV